MRRELARQRGDEAEAPHHAGARRESGDAAAVPRIDHHGLREVLARRGRRVARDVVTRVVLDLLEPLVPVAGAEHALEVRRVDELHVAIRERVRELVAQHVLEAARLAVELLPRARPRPGRDLDPAFVAEVAVCLAGAREAHRNLVESARVEAATREVPLRDGERAIELRAGHEAHRTAGS